MRNLSLCGLVIAAAASVPVQAQSPAGPPAGKADPQDRFASARAAILKTMEEAKVPSVAIAVVQNGKIVWEEGFGWADRDKQIRATAHTPYSLASVTKPITATAVMKLHQAGKLDVDQPIERYLGGIRLIAGVGSADGVSARRIMSHSAGLPLYGHFYLDGSTPAGSRETISKFAITVFPAGTRFEYSNIGMKILDAAIEQVSGRSYGDYLRREVFAPLGMKNSAVGIPPGMATAVRYDPDRKPMRFYLTDHPGSGDVWSSAHDMARFLAFHMGTPLPGQRAILRDAIRLGMQQVAGAAPMPTAPGAPRRDFGANWILSSVGGHPQIWHSGGQAGVATYVGFYPDQKLGVVVLANSSAPTGVITKAILEVVAPEIAPKLTDGGPSAPQPIPFKGAWAGSVRNYAGEIPITLTFADKGETRVRLGDQAPTALAKAGFADGALSGEFAGTSNIPEAQKYPANFLLKVVPVNGELVGQLVARASAPETVQMLPSFIRLRPVAGAEGAPVSAP